ncbi:MAG: methyltransferase domain-containing protein [Pseudonocardia sp.]|nr:methyltransferase domain-containing protein [Pseudonocardia sp.]
MSGWESLLAEVPRALFIPDTIWVDDGRGFTALSKHQDPTGWQAAVDADAPVVTQVDGGQPPAGGVGGWPSSSCSQPSLVADMLTALAPRPGDVVLEIGTGTGWNAALLAHRVGPAGRVVSIEVDPELAEHARSALTAAGHEPLVITGDGAAGYPTGAPYDRLISTAAVREVLPSAWLAQLRPGSRLVTPWGTDYANGALLTLELGRRRTATGRFHGDVAFMRLRDQRRSLRSWEPDEQQITDAQLTTTTCRGRDLDRMLNPAKGKFVIGIRLADTSLHVEWDKHGPGRHTLDLDDPTTCSFARLEADLTNPAPFIVRQLGPRRLWDEAEAAYDWWHGHRAPGPERLGITITPDTQTVWLDKPTTIVRRWSLAPPPPRQPSEETSPWPHESAENWVAPGFVET